MLLTPTIILSQRSLTCLGITLLSTLHLANLPTTDNPQTQGGTDIHKSGENLNPQIGSAAASNMAAKFEGNRFGDGTWWNKREPGDAQPRGEISDADDLCKNRGDCGPICACNGANQNGEETNDPHTISKDPDDETKQTAEESQESGNVDSTKSITEHANKRTTKTLAKIEQSGDNTTLMRGQTNRESKVGNTETTAPHTPAY